MSGGILGVQKKKNALKNRQNKLHNESYIKNLP